MSILRQLAVHKLSAKFSLPQEMAHEILGFCFYDTVTAVYRAVHKTNMTEIVDRFDNAYISRAKPDRSCSPEFSLDPDNSELWSVYLLRDYQEYGDEVQFQAMNCRICGNYKICRTYQPTDEQLEVADPENHFWQEAIPLRMRCYCDH